MDFIAWCDQVLTSLVQLQNDIPTARQYGVREEQIAQVLYKSDTLPYQPGFFESRQRIGMWNALVALEQVGLIMTGHNSVFIKATPDGRLHLEDPVPLWQGLCSQTLDANQAALLRAVNQLCVHEEVDYLWLDEVDNTALQAILAWSDTALAEAITQELATQYGLVEWRAYMGGSYKVRPAYHGLAWETRRGYTLDAQHIDSLVAEWETTSVDFKRELYTKTADQKAEFIKDVLGLANTKASGKRWMIIGFDDKTRAYHGSPDPKIKQDHFEQLLARYTEPMVNIRYDVVDYRRGKVGRLEVLRDPTELPYKVKMDVGSIGPGGKHITAGQIFVRHGSQTEAPTADELKALHGEAAFARASTP